MPAGLKADSELQIGHVLFMDIVGFSKLLIDEQSEATERLTQIVLNCDQIRRAEAEEKLIRLPTGDGMALIFFTSPEAPVQCALEISKAMNDLPEKIPLRMGIHSGPVNKIVDVNKRANVAGAGINIAQRVMDCADAGHILLSKRVADDLAQNERWRACLHDLGKVEVKHGAKIDVVNLYTDEIGNRQLPDKLKSARQDQARAGRKRRNVILLGLLAIVLAGVAVSFLFLRWSAQNLGSSIAVLPFENLSAEKENAYFAGGIQDEVLSNLAKIGDLKVISRTSVSSYTGKQRNIREIAKALGVTAVVEGSVQRVANRLRVAVQLINGRNDDRIWAQDYEREVKDVFELQRDLALEIAARLNAKLTPSEKARIQQKPTKNAEAYLVFLQAEDMWAIPDLRDEYTQQVFQLYERAIQLDPSFALALARLSLVESDWYWWRGSTKPALLEKARAAASEAIRLQPNLPEAHLAVGYVYYLGDRDFERALVEFNGVKAQLPNNPDVFEAIAKIERRRGKWAESTADLEKAASLSPRDQFLMTRPANNYALMRNFPPAVKAVDRRVDMYPSFVSLSWRAELDIAWKGDMSAMEKFLANTTEDPEGQATELRLGLKLFQRKYSEALQVLNNYPGDRLMAAHLGPAPKCFFLAQVYQLMNDKAKAQALFEEARRMVEPSLHEKVAEPHRQHALLGEIYAGLGRKEDAIREGKLAVELKPESKDAVDGPTMKLILAQIYAAVGEPDAALPLLEHCLSVPSPITAALLRLDPVWDPLRKDPRFQKLINDNKPSS